MNRTRFLALSLILLHGTFCFAADDPIPLWSVGHPGGKVFLLGSIHLLKEEITPYRGAIRDAFSESDCLVVEAYIGSENMMANAGKMMQAGTLPEGQSLETILPADRYRDLVKLVEELGFDVKAYRQYRPWMLALTISSFSMIKQGYNPLLGVDIHFIKQAESRKMVIEELEGVDAQIDLFRNMTPKEETAFLFSSLLEQKEQEKMVDRIVESWKKGRLGELADILLEGERENPELKNFYRNLILKRNEQMAEKILGFIRDQRKCFVIVGAAHLIGENGIVELLRKKGVEVTLY